MQTETTDVLLKPQEVAAILRVSLDALARYRVLGTGPKFLKFGTKRSSHVRYRRSDVEAWIAARFAQSTSDMQSAWK